MSSLTVFQFESHEIRFVGTAEKLEWVALDVVAILYPESDKRNYSNYLKKVRANWKGHKKIMTLGGEQEVVTLFEPGFYQLLGRSNSVLAEPFQTWLYEEVVPSIRKTGIYAIAPTEQPALPPAPPTPQQISELFDLTLGQSGLDPKLVAGVKLSAIANYYPALKSATETAKSFLGVELESELVTPTQLGKILSEVTGDSWSAQRINKTLIDQGFQVVNPPGDPDYLPTEKGKEHSKVLANTTKGHAKTVQHLRWFKSVLEALEVNDH